jgi:hypothetical protein
LGHGTDTETKSRLRFWLFRIVSSFDSWYDAGLSYLSPLLLLFSFFLPQLSFFFLFLFFAYFRLAMMGPAKKVRF